MSDAGDQGPSTATREEATVDLGEIAPRGTRQQWRRSAVLLSDDTAFVGTADGAVRAIDTDSASERFREPVGERTVALTAGSDELVVGTRGADGWLRGLDPDTGERRWSIRTADDIGEPTKETLFYQPFVVDLLVSDGRAVAAARRYERDPSGEGPDREFHSIVYGIEDGRVQWRYETDGSPIALDERDGSIAVAFNRCPGGHDAGVVVLDAATGEERWCWNPDGDGRRRAGDVEFVDSGVAVASHADYRGYLLEEGSVRWRVDLGRPEEHGEETLYTYPTHAEPLDDGVAFLTGNTFPEDGRQADGRHTNEHTLAVVDSEGVVSRRDSIGGWVGTTVSVGDEVLIPCGQHFRDRDPSRHGLYSASADRTEQIHSTAGPVTAVDGTDRLIAAVEDPVEFHDDDDVHGTYQLHLLSR